MLVKRELLAVIVRILLGGGALIPRPAKHDSDLIVGS